MEECLNDMYLTITEILQSEGESAQQRWMIVQNMEESIAAVVNMDMRAVTPDALRELGLSVTTLVGNSGRVKELPPPDVRS